jgi:hypothetical protein
MNKFVNISGRVSFTVFLTGGKELCPGRRPHGGFFIQSVRKRKILTNSSIK